MTKTKNTHLALAAVVAVGLTAGGAAFAATKLHGSHAAAVAGATASGSFVSAGSGGTAAGARGAFHGGGPGHGPGDELAAAATYLGVTQSSLVTSLQAGKTLAQVATATSGKSVAGLVDALIAAEKTELAAAVTAGRLTQAQSDKITAGLKAHVTAEVNETRDGGPGRGHDGPGHGPGDGLAAAATYLGVTQTSLMTSLQSGKTLAQVADATAGKSAAGLIDALVAAAKTKIAAAVTAGDLTQAQADEITSGLKAHITAEVNDMHADHDGPGGHGFRQEGGPLPAGAPSDGTHI